MTKFSNSVHFVLQPKGGVGKSFVASILAQFFIKEIMVHGVVLSVLGNVTINVCLVEIN